MGNCGFSLYLIITEPEKKHMFRGISNLNVDSKGRLAIPSRYRESVQLSSSGQMIVTVDHMDSCLLIYAMNFFCIASCPGLEIIISLQFYRLK